MPDKQGLKKKVIAFLVIFIFSLIIIVTADVINGGDISAGRADIPGPTRRITMDYLVQNWDTYLLLAFLSSLLLYVAYLQDNKFPPKPGQ